MLWEFLKMQGLAFELMVQGREDRSDRSGVCLGCADP